MPHSITSAKKDEELGKEIEIFLHCVGNLPVNNGKYTY